MSQCDLITTTLFNLICLTVFKITQDLKCIIKLVVIHKLLIVLFCVYKQEIKIKPVNHKKWFIYSYFGEL